MPKKRKKIDSFKEFHKMIPTLVRELERDQQLTVRALANPLLAIEELGYDLPKDVQKKVERLLRFRPAERKRLRELEKQVHKAAPRPFDLDSPEEVKAILFRELKLKKPKNLKSAAQADIVSQGALLSHGRTALWSDPLEPLKGAHHVMTPLLAYRAIQANRPGFAPPSLYAQLKTGERRLPITKIKVRFPESRMHQGVEDA